MIRVIRCVFFGAVLLSLGFGCNRSAGTKPELRPNSSATPADDALDSAKDTLRKEVGLKACRNAIQKINGYFSRNPDQRPQPLTDAQRKFLNSQNGLDEEELAEVNSTTFTVLDAHYLDQCFLLRDAVRSFGIQDWDALPRAEATFDWVMRQVRLQERDGPPNPPHLALRRGWGTSLERAFIFLALLQQQGIDGSIITYPLENQGQTYARFWLPGVLIDKNIYLFDTRLGMPLPSPKGPRTATLAEVLAHADPFHALQIDEKHHYDVAPAQVKKAEIYPAWSLSSFAPRMRYLEDLMAANNRVHLACEPAAVLQKFREAGKDLGTPIHSAAKFGEPTSPLRLFREFFPPAEGGIDKYQRKLVFENELFPWKEVYFQHFGDMPLEVDFGNDLGVAFQKLFVEFPLPPLRQQGIANVETILRGKDEEEKHRDEIVLRMIQTLVPLTGVKVFALSPDHYALAPRTPRDDLLRGRFEDATSKLVEVLDQVSYQMELAKNTPNLDQVMQQWRSDAKSVQADLVRVREGVKSQLLPEQLVSERKRLWFGNLLDLAEEKEKPGPKIRVTPQLPPWLIRLLGAAATPMRVDAAYLLALCKHEQAERMQARFNHDAKEKSAVQAWESAQVLWNDFLEKHATAPQAAAARLWQARALAALNQPEAASALLKDAKNLTPLEETARLYWARMLKKE